MDTNTIMQELNVLIEKAQAFIKSPEVHSNDDLMEETPGDTLVFEHGVSMVLKAAAVTSKEYNKWLEDAISTMAIKGQITVDADNSDYNISNVYIEDSVLAVELDIRARYAKPQLRFYEHGDAVSMDQWLSVYRLIKAKAA